MPCSESVRKAQATGEAGASALLRCMPLRLGSAGAVRSPRRRPPHAGRRRSRSVPTRARPRPSSRSRAAPTETWKSSVRADHSICADAEPEHTAELLRRVVEAHPLPRGLPHHFEGHNGALRWPTAADKGVLQSEVVLHGQVAHVQTGCARFTVELDALAGRKDRPEEAVRRDTGVEVVDLFISPIPPPVPGVKTSISKQRKRPDTTIAVLFPVDALHEAHVIKQEWQLPRLPRSGGSSACTCR